MYENQYRVIMRTEVGARAVDFVVADNFVFDSGHVIFTKDGVNVRTNRLDKLIQILQENK